MTNDQKINAVAVNMRLLMTFLDRKVTELIGTPQHNIVLVIGCCDVSQYAANMPRAASVELLKDLLARWQLGMDDVLPGEVSPGSTQAFEYLLNSMELAGQASEPALCGYHSKRSEVLAYVARLEAKARRVAQ